jgi:hypothetical protein
MQCRCFRSDRSRTLPPTDAVIRFTEADYGLHLVQSCATVYRCITAKGLVVMQVESYKA